MDRVASHRLMRMHAAQNSKMLAEASNGLSLSEREHTEGPAQRKHKLERERRSRRCQPQQHYRRHQPSSHKISLPVGGGSSSRGVDFKHSAVCMSGHGGLSESRAGSARASNPQAASPARLVGCKRGTALPIALHSLMPSHQACWTPIAFC